jgi:hypothetical protein
MGYAAVRYTPENIEKLEPGEIFVFGSNLEGIHGAGAARVAWKKFGALLGIGRGMQGQSYAIPTKANPRATLSLADIESHIRQFLIEAQLFKNKDKTFLVTKIGCGLAGHSVGDIGEIFRRYPIPRNVVLPWEFSEHYSI